MLIFLADRRLPFYNAGMKHSSYIVAGPTASGKSDFAHALAKRVGGAVINCDSVQIYAGIENISASPMVGKNTPEIDGIPYRLFSVLPLTQQISVAKYLVLARKEYDDVIAAGKIPIFVGGSGFYVSALLHGISPIPEISEENRKRARDMVRDYKGAARQLLKNADPDNACTDPQRIARALEVFLETGLPLSDWQKLPRTGAVLKKAFKILISPHRDILTERIAGRIPEMIKGGAIDEARAVMAAGWDPSRAIGADEAVKFVKKESTEEEMIANWITRTNQYAKRQQTWFRNQYATDVEINHVPTEAYIDMVLRT